MYILPRSIEKNSRLFHQFTFISILKKSLMQNSKQTRSKCSHQQVKNFSNSLWICKPTENYRYKSTVWFYKIQHFEKSVFIDLSLILLICVYIFKCWKIHVCHSEEQTKEIVNAKMFLTRLCNLLLDLSYNSSLMKKRHVYEINRL